MGGITGLTFHDLRHEAASRLSEKELGAMQVADITGRWQQPPVLLNSGWGKTLWMIHGEGHTR